MTTPDFAKIAAIAAACAVLGYADPVLAQASGQNLDWPDAFAVVGVAFAFVCMIWLGTR